MEESEQLKEKYFATFAFFEYRKIMRLLGGEMFEKGTSPFIVVAIWILYVVNFLVSNLTIDNNALVFNFYQRKGQPGEGFVVNWFTSAVIFHSFALVFIATYWQIRSICEICFAVFCIFTVVLLVEGGVEKDYQSYGNSIIEYILTCILFTIVVYYIWNYYYAPLIMIWKYGRIANYESITSQSTSRSTNANAMNTGTGTGPDEIVSNSDGDETLQPSKAAESNSNEMNDKTTKSKHKTRRKRKKLDPKFKKQFIAFPYLSTILLVIFFLLYFVYLPIFGILVAFFFLLNLFGIISWEFLSVKLFFKVDRSYWIFEKLNHDNEDMNEKMNGSISQHNSSDMNTFDQIAYYPRLPWYSLKYAFKTLKKTSKYFQFSGDCHQTQDYTVQDTNDQATGNFSHSVATVPNPMQMQPPGSPSSISSVPAPGKPHGYGEWKDSDIHGETFGGMFVDGTPIAPYVTREKIGQGTFRNQRIGFATIANSDINNIDPAFPSYIPADNGYNGLCYGTAEVECCVSGTFYYNFPRTNFMSDCQPPNVSLSVSEMWDKLNEPYIVDVNASEFSKQLQYEITGFETKKISASATTPTSSPHHFRLHRTSSIHHIHHHEVVVDIDEVVLFIPGFNSCLRWSLNTYGQFLELAGFPDSISPFLFCWPQGAVLTYFQAKAAAQSDETALRLYQLLYDFKAKCGVRRVNIIGHSMGARVLASFFDKFNGISIDSSGRAFMKASHVSKSRDNQVNSSFSVDLEKGESMSNLDDGQSESYGYLPQFGAVLFVNGEADLTMFQSGYKKCMHDLAESITLMVDTTDFALVSAQYFNYLEQWYRKEPLSLTLGRCLCQVYDNYENNSTGQLLDIDVINVSLIEGSNVEKKQTLLLPFISSNIRRYPRAHRVEKASER